ncbi:phosphonate C-P lyase system protein PhnH [Limnoraphis robusta]|uniref:Phosphonate C-P lyase system protein PhnH n=2 Tax=Limnoraphis TaxID=1332112 RepID=A0ABU5TW29_9CYAN|nr:phosphonate C-P lyase system protein PhnH [Limnoraphis robusta]MEA5519019.1 phosphonate C-P lyase system protein PhnH [Limnoraphis robusta CCNP1315]MEA5544131.1 phosphonate C-P lyase system protein PhnH [Limnoraphis robusta CCNP1324]
MEITQFPGLKDPIHDAQITFRALLDALSFPGRTQEIFVQLTPPPGLTLACAAACLTLLDLETTVWLSSDFEPEVKSWLKFHTGCHFTEHPKAANFAMIQKLCLLPAFSNFNWGTAEQPELSTTLLIQVEPLEKRESVRLEGPGISEKRVIKLPLSSTFRQGWLEINRSYPLGIDVFLLGENTVIGLPRTTTLSIENP